jgi:nucleotide-binding universal stress UspA family protein
MHFPATLVVATDFSWSAAAAFERAVELARHFDALLHIVHVLHQPPQWLVPFDRPARHVKGDATRQVARELLELCAKKADRRGVEAITHLATGRVASEITELAEAVGADWIVVGTHEPTGLKRAVLGCVAEQVVREASSTVVVVRSEQPAGRPAFGDLEALIERFGEPDTALVA